MWWSAGWFLFLSSCTGLSRLDQFEVYSAVCPCSSLFCACSLDGWESCGMCIGDTMNWHEVLSHDVARRGAIANVTLSGSKWQIVAMLSPFQTRLRPQWSPFQTKGRACASKLCKPMKICVRILSRFWHDFSSAYFDVTCSMLIA